MATLTIEVDGIDAETVREAFGGDDKSDEGVEMGFDEQLYRQFNGEHGPDARTDDFSVSVEFEE